ncbi:MAG: hypothetical protein WC600_04940 [Desulfobaccales bacterium]
MRILGFLMITALAVVLLGCATFQRSQVIDTDKLEGYAAGTFKEDSSGPTGSLDVAGSGAAWGGGGAMGVAGINLRTGPPPNGALDFARAVAMINYSKKLTSVKYDQFGGVIDYEFDQTPLARSKYRDPATAPKLPSSFGHQPIE